MSTTKKRPKKSAKKSVKKSGKVTVKKTKPVAVPKKKAAKRAVAKKAAPKRAAARSKAKAAPVSGTADFWARAYAMEAEAAERYAEFADAMEVHNNREVAELFRKLSRIEQRHADQILEQMGWKQSPAAGADYRWEGAEGPESADPTALHYLMQPYHALQIALRNEKRARDYFAKLVQQLGNGALRKAALEMKQEEAEHVQLIEEWLTRTPVPDANWQADPDPPVLSD